MKRPICFISILYLFAVGISVAQEQQASTSSMIPGLRRRALTIDINAKVLDEEQAVIWEQFESKNTIPGSPVGLKLVGSNIVVVVQFTPFIRRNGDNVLVAQGQIWIDDPQRGMCYYTSIQTIPIEFDEPIYFFPLGSQQLDSSLEIILTVNQYKEPDYKEPNYKEPDIVPAAERDGN